MQAVFICRLQTGKPLTHGFVVRGVSQPSLHAQPSATALENKGNKCKTEEEESKESSWKHPESRDAALPPTWWGDEGKHLLTTQSRAGAEGTVHGWGGSGYAARGPRRCARRAVLPCSGDEMGWRGEERKLEGFTKGRRRVLHLVGK